MYLLMDTSTFRAQIGLGNEKLIDSYAWDSKQNLSDTLLIEIDKLLRKNKIDSKDIEGIIAYLGPGSYTSLRIGISTANAFAFSLKIPIVGVKGKPPGEEKMIIDEMESQDLEELLEKGLKLLHPKGVRHKPPLGCYLTPFYGKEPNTGGSSK